MHKRIAQIRPDGLRPYDLAVFIGRFAPYHKGHKTIIEEALKIAERVIVLVGSANATRSFRNPFTYEERRDMIESVHVFDSQRMIIEPLNDYTYDLNSWLEEVQATVNKHVRTVGWRDYGPKVTLIGHSKDKTSYYLKLFPMWDSVNVEQEHVISATDIREDFFGDHASYLFDDSGLEPEVSNYLQKFRMTGNYAHVKAEHDWCKNYLKPWRTMIEGERVIPYDPTFNTVDCVIRCSGHILLITRRARPGLGLWALPGGFLNQDETLLEGALRETSEETNYPVEGRGMDPGLIKFLKNAQTYDDVHRDPRGRFITRAFYFDLGNLENLPRVKAGSDAARAQWVPIADLRADKMFADHYHIIRDIMK